MLCRVRRMGAAPSGETTVTDENSTSPGSRARLLVVDDSATALRLLQAVLEGEHYDVVTACDGREGLEKVQQCRPDLIVTDSLMPGVDGFAFLRRLRENPATRLIPVIMLTSGDPRNSEHQHSGSQPDAFVTKSVVMEPLLYRVKDLLQRTRRDS